MRIQEAIWSRLTSSRFPFAAAETLAGARTITFAEVEMYMGFAFDPDGAGRTITLPAEEKCVGTVILIANTADGAEVLTINNDAAAAICTPTQNESALVWCDGTAWYGLVGDFA